MKLRKNTKVTPPGPAIERQAKHQSGTVKLDVGDNEEATGPASRVLNEWLATHAGEYDLDDLWQWASEWRAGPICRDHSLSAVGIAEWILGGLEVEWVAR
ncbi:hypothetical protein GCM10027290_50970 [Micromonospora sonneratiae]|uniref:Uncharacterized protein n=1 Tax=Micromonospora sonneratiae TaxID=1184706 RepID=A0ABW3Y9X9_9ACTN